jgi:hypothetical protein
VRITYLINKYPAVSQCFISGEIREVEGPATAAARFAAVEAPTGAMAAASAASRERPAELGSTGRFGALAMRNAMTGLTRLPDTLHPKPASRAA